MGDIVLFWSVRVKQRLHRMDAGRDGSDKIKERNVSTNEHKRGRIDRCAKKAAILLKNLDISMRPRVKMHLDNGLKRRVDGSRKLQDTSV